MEKKEYKARELREMGDLVGLTKNSTMGEGFDANWNDQTQQPIEWGEPFNGS